MTMKRRHLLLLAPIAAIALAGCGTLTQQEAAELQVLIAGARNVEADISAAAPQMLWR